MTKYGNMGRAKINKAVNPWAEPNHANGRGLGAPTREHNGFDFGAPSCVDNVFGFGAPTREYNGFGLGPRPAKKMCSGFVPQVKARV